MDKEVLTLYSDGGARGNPGPAGIGFVIFDQDTLIATGKKYIGTSTNNKAEYLALIEGIQKAMEFHPQRIDCFLDSELVVRQLNGQYKVKDQDLGSLFVRIWNLKQSVNMTFHHIPRAQNKQADALVNEAIDEAGF